MCPVHPYKNGYPKGDGLLAGFRAEPDEFLVLKSLPSEWLRLVQMTETFGREDLTERFFRHELAFTHDFDHAASGAMGFERDSVAVS